jgi:hypothetical protein
MDARGLRLTIPEDYFAILLIGSTLSTAAPVDLHVEQLIGDTRKFRASRDVHQAKTTLWQVTPSPPTRLFGFMASPSFKRHNFFGAKDQAFIQQRFGALDFIRRLRRSQRRGLAGDRSASIGQVFEIRGDTADSRWRQKYRGRWLTTRRSEPSSLAIDMANTGLWPAGAKSSPGEQPQPRRQVEGPHHKVHRHHSGQR